MTNRLFRTGRAVAVLGVAVWFAATAPTLQAQELRMHVSEDSITVGQRFYLSLTAEHDFAAEPQFPEATDSLVFGDLEVLRRQARNSFSRGDARIDSIVYEVTTFALDTAVVAPIPVTFTAGEDTFSVRTRELSIRVVSLVPPDAEDVRDLAPLVDFPRPLWPYVVGAAALLLLAALIAFYVLRRRRRRQGDAPVVPERPLEPADVEALTRLRALEATNLDEPDSAQPYYTELADTLRHYLARRIHVQSMETTTSELLRDLERRNLPRPDTRHRLRNVLSLCDYVKFADAVPPPDRGRDALRSAVAFVESVEDELRPPAPSGDDSAADDDAANGGFGDRTVESSIEMRSSGPAEPHASAAESGESEWRRPRHGRPNNGDSDS